MATKPASHVVLLRGINVGGKNKLPMKALAELCGDLGCEQVRTYIQSGNVVCNLGAGIAKSLPATLAAGINKRFGLQVPVVLYSARELLAVVDNNPFLALAGDGGEAHKKLHVAFLARRPTKKQVASLDPQRSPGDRFFVRGRDVYLFCPNGVARTKLTTAWLDKTLSTTSTMRNWRTVLKLAEMSAS